MIRKDVAIINKLGLHARAAAKFVACASTFGSKIEVQMEGRSVSGKSIMGVMMLAASQGKSILLEINGEDEEAACAALEQLIADRFEEVE